MTASHDNIQLSILVIDDDTAILRAIENFLKARAHRVYLAEGGSKGLEILRSEIIDIVITDIKMPDMDGFEVLRQVRRCSPDTEVIMITGFGEIEIAVKAMRQGAFDFFTKPFDVQDLNAALERTVRFQTLRREKDHYRECLDRIGEEARQNYGLNAIVGKSPGIRTVKNLISEVCQSDRTTVLIRGETGTGKELAARAIHYGSDRSEGPFVAVDCSAIPGSLVESEFYGHVRGAFTDARQAHKGYFEQADGGTLFLDEIGDMNLGMQATLLRTLEERRVRPLGGSKGIPVKVRVVSATNQDLPAAISEGKFREDLFYRLNTFAIHVPPLRERPEDILQIAGHFLKICVRDMHKPIEGISPEAERMLEAHPFPGNIRELRNLIERAVILCKTSQVRPEELEFSRSVLPANPAPVSDPSPEGDPDLRSVLKKVQAPDLNLSSVETELIREALRRGKSQVRAAQLLGISRDALRRRMKQYNLKNSG